MKPFNLEEAKAGKPLCTRDGDKARIVCFDVQGRMPPFVALITDEDGDEHLSHHWEDGTSVHNSGEDLFMAQVKREGWVTVYKQANGVIIIGNIMFPSHEVAVRDSPSVGRLAIVHIEWDE